MFGMENHKKLIKGNGDKSATKIVDTIVEELGNFRSSK